MKAMDVCLRHLFTIPTTKIKWVLVILCRSYPFNFLECCILYFSSLESSFCSGEPCFLMRRCLASINQELKPQSHSWRCSAWTLSRLNKQMAEDSWCGADTGQQESCPAEPWKEKVQWAENHSFFPKLLWEAVTPELLQGLFHGTWVAALLSCTNTILCCVFQLLAA